MGISIHAPARGATWTDTSPVKDMVDFNPRSRKGSDEGGEASGAAE